jgi:peptidoglycan/LPS O-acetylase OafA/YrhL
MYKSIQTCRGLAALQVVLFHLGGLIAAPKYFGAPGFARAFIFGDSGVEFFFVLSGFIITWVHRRDFGHPAALPSYALKRLIRIFPAYWSVFLAVFLLACLSPSLRAQLPWDPGTLVRSLLLLPQDPTKVGGTGAPVLIVAWTLQYEMVFYGAVGASIVHRALIVAVAALALANNIGCLHGCSFPQSFYSNRLLLLFAFGACVAWVSEGHLVLKRPLAMAIIAAMAYGVLICVDITTEKAGYPLDRSIAYGLVFSLLILALVQSEIRGFTLGRAMPFQLLGDASYALYLIHFPLLSALSKVAVAAGLRGMSGAVAAFAIMLAATVAVSVGFHLHIERHMLRTLSRIIPQRRVAVARSQ